MAADITVFRLPAKHLGQLGSSDLLTLPNQPGATNVLIDSGAGSIQQIKGDSAVAAAVAVTCTNVPLVGLLILLLTASGAGTVTYTLGAGFKVTGTAAPTTGKNIAITFISDGTNWIEVGRTSAAV